MAGSFISCDSVEHGGREARYSDTESCQVTVQTVPERAEVYELTWAMGSGLKAQAHVLTEPRSLEP